MMELKLKPIRSEIEYQAALDELSYFFDSDPDVTATQEAVDYYEVLGTLVEAYEREHYPVELPDPIEAIRFRMEQMGLEIKDMEDVIGKPNRVYEVFGRKRPLTINMIRRLHDQLGIPAEVLIQPMIKTVHP